MEPTAKIIIAAHKKYRMPKDELYLPLHVGAAVYYASENNRDGEKKTDLGYQRDDAGENISSLNPSFCELTGLYWAWKNLDHDYIGLSHYRRHFSLHHKKGFENILTMEQLRPYLGKISVFTPNKRFYIIETLYSHYAHTHFASHLDKTRAVIHELCPEYITSFDQVLGHVYGYMFNMMIMRRDLLDDYLSWLFEILFKLRDIIELPKDDPFQARCFGRISEILFNVWLDHKLSVGELNKSEIMEIPVVHMEKTDWFKKGRAFLKAKFMGAKYKGSF